MYRGADDTVGVGDELSFQDSLADAHYRMSWLTGMLRQRQYQLGRYRHMLYDLGSRLVF